MNVDAPPGMQQWIRETDAKLLQLDRQLTANEVKLANPKLRQYAAAATDETILVGPTGAAGLSKMPVDSGPNVVVTTLTGLLKISIFCFQEMIWDGSISCFGLGGMSFSITDAWDAGTDLGDEYTRAVARQYTFDVGYPPYGQDSTSLSQILQVPPGTYTIRAEYLYQTSDASIHMEWSARTLIAQPL